MYAYLLTSYWRRPVALLELHLILVRGATLNALQNAFYKNCSLLAFFASARRSTRSEFILLYLVIYMTYLFFWVGVLVFYDLLLKSLVVSDVGRRKNCFT